MVKWLNKKDRAKLQFEYHKGTVEARKAIIQEMFDWSVTYENFCEDWMERIETAASSETDENKMKELTKSMKRAAPPEDYFWKMICRSIFSGQSYVGRKRLDGEGKVIADDPEGLEAISKYFYPLNWMMGHCQFLLGDEDDARFYGMPDEIPHNAKTRLFQGVRIFHRFWREVIAILGVAYILELFREIVTK